MKKLLSICLCILISFGLLPSPVLAETTDNQEFICGELTVDLADFESKNGTIVLYENADTGMKLSIDISSVEDSISTQATTGNSGWSGGSIPGGTTILTPKLTNPTVLYVVVGFNMNVTIGSSGNKINSVYNPTISTLALTLSSINCGVNNSIATSNNPARATMTWLAIMSEQGITVGSESNYFTVELNTSSQLRMTWRLSA